MKGLPVKQGGLYLLLIGAFLLPTITEASVEITEIMYSPAGADNGHEWIEVRNVSSSSVNLADWSFRENDINHNLESTGSGILPAGEFAIIADDPSLFSADYPGANGLVFDSSFGLRNGGEPIALLDAADNVIDQVTYDPSVGADGTGDSLQLSVGSWLAAGPTPNATNATESSQDNEETEDEDNDNESDLSSGTVIRFLDPRPEEEASDGEQLSVSDSDTVTIDPGEDLQAVAGVPVRLRGVVSASDSTFLDNRSIYWTLGNGSTKQGADIFYTYQHPGSYVATLIVSDPERDLSANIIVEVVSPDLEVAETMAGQEGYIRIANNTGRSIDLSGWHLRARTDHFTLPAHTTALDGADLIVANTASGISTETEVELLYPDGTVAYAYRNTPENDPAIESSADDEVSTTNENAGSGEENVANDTPEEQSSFSGQEESENTMGDQTATTVSLAGAFSSSSQPAAAAAAGGSMFFHWAGMLTLLLTVVGGAVVSMHYYGKREDDPDIIADRFDINEI